MRRLGIGVLGLFSGLFLGLLMTDAIARPMVASGGDLMSVPLGLFLGFAPPLLAVIGIFVALRIDRKMQSKKQLGN